MPDATKNVITQELFGEPLRLELNFTFPLEHLIELIVLGERTPPVELDKIGVVGKRSKMDKVSLQKSINPF